MRRSMVAGVAFLLAVGACGGGTDDTADSVSGPAVGASGGAVTSSDGRLSLQVPAGALSDPAAITAEPGALEDLPDDLKALGPIGVYLLEPAGLQFAEPVAFELEMELPAADEGVALPVFALHSEDGTTTPLDTTTRIDAGSGVAVVTGTIDHFSMIVGFSGELTVALEKVEPETRPVGSLWSAAVLATNTSDHEISVQTVAYLAEGTVHLAGEASSRGFDLAPGLTLSANAPNPSADEGPPAEGAWRCEEVGRGFYGVNVAATGIHPGAMDRLPSSLSVEVFGSVDCVAAPADAADDNTTGGEDPSDNTTGEETPLEVPVICEDNIGTEFAPVSCEADGVPRPGTSAVVELEGETLSVTCSPDCGAPGDWAFQQYLVELWTSDDKAILCDNDPNFGCRYTDMQTYALASAEADGVTVPDLGLSEEEVAVQMTKARFAEVDGILDFVKVVIQWWWGEDPADTDIAVLTVEGEELEALSEGLAEDGEVTVGGIFGQ